MPSKIKQVHAAAERVSRTKETFARASERLLEHMEKPHPYPVCQVCEDLCEVVDTARTEMHREIQAALRHLPKETP